MVKPRKRKSESVEQYNERVSKLYYSEGYHIKEIADKLQIDILEVYNYVSNGYKITTEAEREEMIHLYNQGYSYTAIGKIFNRSHSCVKDRIERPAKFNHGDKNKLTEEQLKKMKDMVNSGKNMEEIAREIGISVRSVAYRLRHTNMRKTYTNVSKAELNKFIRLHKKGKTHKQIAELCNRSRSTISRHLSAAGY